MRTEDPIQGVSVRNTKRHIRKKWLASAVGDDGPQLPDYQFPVTRKNVQDHVHPRSLRIPDCPCGYPAKKCEFWTEDNERNYCFKEHGNG